MIQRCQGFTLVEILVAIVIFSVSLLGLASLQGRVIQANNGAHSTSIATSLVHNATDFIKDQSQRKNPIFNDLDDFVAHLDGGSNYQGNLDPTCLTSASGCSREDTVKHHMAVWERELGEKLINGRGHIKKETRSISADGFVQDFDVYKITIFWNNPGTRGTGLDCSMDLSIDMSCLKSEILP